MLFRSGDRELLLASGAPHWRSFAEMPVPYQASDWSRWLLPCVAITLLMVALSGLIRLDPKSQILLLHSLMRLVYWLPALYGLLALGYVGRYVRWRLLLGSCGIGRCCWPDLSSWFLGFSLTATPGKLGELSRVQQLHTKLGYPRLPLVHAFADERFCDAIAVAFWLIALIPRSIVWPTLSPWILLVVVIAVAVVTWLGRILVRRWSQWRHHFPQGPMLRACAPAFLASLLIWGCEGLLLWLLLLALSPTPISASTAIAIYLLSGTLGLASSLPGGIGVNEAATVMLLGQHDIPIGVALPVAVVRRLITPWSVVGIAATLALFSAPKRIQPER